MAYFAIAPISEKEVATMKIIRTQNGDIVNFDYIKRCSFSAQNSVIYAVTDDNDRLILYQGNDVEERYIDFWQALKRGQSQYSFVEQDQYLSVLYL